MNDDRSENRPLPDQTPSFIPKELRPAASKEPSAVVSPGTPRKELRERAAALLGPLLRGMLGLDSAAPVTLAAHSRCLRSAQVTFVEVEGEAVLLDLASGHYYTLNRPALFIWEQLTGERDLETIRSMICERFQVDPATAWQDLCSLVNALCAEKLASLEAPRDGRS
jgi:hypothetical protein